MKLTCNNVLSLWNLIHCNLKGEAQYPLQCIPAKPLHNRDIASVHFNHLLCMGICDKLSSHISMLTYIYLNVDKCWLTSSIPSVTSIARDQYTHQGLVQGCDVIQKYNQGPAETIGDQLRVVLSLRSITKDRTNTRGPVKGCVVTRTYNQYKYQ